eukprot:g814.t1
MAENLNPWAKAEAEAEVEAATSLFPTHVEVSVCPGPAGLVLLDATKPEGAAALAAAASVCPARPHLPSAGAVLAAFRPLPSGVRGEVEESGTVPVGAVVSAVNGRAVLDGGGEEGEQPGAMPFEAVLGLIREAQSDDATLGFWLPRLAAPHAGAAEAPAADAGGGVGDAVLPPAPPPPPPLAPPPLDDVFDAFGSVRPGLGALRCFRVTRVGWTSKTEYDLVITRDEVLLLPAGALALASAATACAPAAVQPRWRMLEALASSVAAQRAHDASVPTATAAPATAAAAAGGGGTVPVPSARWLLEEVHGVQPAPKGKTEEFIISVGPSPAATAAAAAAGASAKGSGGWFGLGGGAGAAMAGMAGARPPAKKEAVTLRTRYRVELLSALAEARDNRATALVHEHARSAGDGSKGATVVLAPPLAPACIAAIASPNTCAVACEDPARTLRQFVAVRWRRGGPRRWRRVLLEVCPHGLAELKQLATAAGDAASASTVRLVRLAVYPYQHLQRLAPVSAEKDDSSGSGGGGGGVGGPAGLVVVGHKGRLTVFDIIGRAADAGAYAAAGAVIKAAAAAVEAASRAGSASSVVKQQWKSARDFYQADDETNAEVANPKLVSEKVEANTCAEPAVTHKSASGTNVKADTQPSSAQQLDGSEVVVQSEAEKRKTALTKFYEHHDPSKICDVDTLLSGKYEFVEVVKSLHTKYGSLPEGWDAKLNPPKQLGEAREPLVAAKLV